MKNNMKNIMKKTYITPLADTIIARPAQMLCGSLDDLTINLDEGVSSGDNEYSDGEGYGEAW